MTETIHTPDSSRQQTHYDRIIEDYQRHYFDAESMEYRRRFFYDVMFDGIDIDGMRVAELACGSGLNSVEMQKRFPDATFVGFDISGAACDAYRRNVGSEAFRIDLTKSHGDQCGFDVAIIIGGLHHCIADLPGTLRNIAEMVKPGGWFLMVEPNSRFLLEGVRRLWYRLDSYFDAETESALDYDELIRIAGGAFSCAGVTYGGGPAYYLIYNSLLFRLPSGLKKAISRPLLEAEPVINRLPGRFWAPYFIARWKRS